MSTAKAARNTQWKTNAGLAKGNNVAIVNTIVETQTKIGNIFMV